MRLLSFFRQLSYTAIGVALVPVFSLPARSASFYDMPGSFCSVYAHACARDNQTVHSGMTRVRKPQRVLHAGIALGCDTADINYQAKVFTQGGHDRCKITFAHPFHDIPFISVASRPDTPDITSYSIPTVIEAGPDYAIIETVQVNAGKVKIYHGGFDLIAIGQ